MTAFGKLRLASVILSAAANAAVFHVAPGGRDSASGSPTAPFQTLTRAVKTAGPGDTILVADGTYGPGSAVTGGDSGDYEVSPVVLRRSGHPSAWITIRAEHKWRAILDCEMRCDSYINLLNASYVAIQDFVITRGYKEGIHSNDAAHHIVLRGNVIENIANRVSSSRYGLDGMFTNAKCHDFLIDGNTFRHIGRLGNSNLDHGLYLRGSNFTVINNVFYDLPSGWPIQLADGLTNVLIANNTFASSSPRRVGQIMFWLRQSDVTIQNNIFYHPDGYAIGRYDSVLTGSCVIDHNVVGRVEAVMQDADGCMLRDNVTGANLKFVNGESPPYDFHLRAGSAGIGAGVSDPRITTDFDGRPRGSSPDAGAFQH
jgi:Right handed beta helix region/Protein of unknown function (DUF1565)